MHSRPNTRAVSQSRFARYVVIVRPYPANCSVEIPQHELPLAERRDHRAPPRLLPSHRSSTHSSLSEFCHPFRVARDGRELQAIAREIQKGQLSIFRRPTREAVRIGRGSLASSEYSCLRNFLLSLRHRPNKTT